MQIKQFVGLIPTGSNFLRFNRKSLMKAIESNYGERQLLMRQPLNQDVVQISNNTQKAANVSVNIPKSNELNNEIITRLQIPNLRVLESNSISGSTFEKRSAEDLKKLKDSGIRAIIDFRSEAGCTFGKKCNELGMDYLNIPIEHSYNIFGGHKKGNLPTTVSDEFVEQLKQFFSLANKGNNYIGCNFGIDRTNIGLVYNYLLNMSATKPPKLLSWGDFSHQNVINRTIKQVKKTIKHLTPEQRETLNLPSNYEEILKERIFRLRFDNDALSSIKQ